MNSSKMSLKEGFDFLFENENKEASNKAKIVGNKDLVNNISNDNKGSVIKFLLGDMVLSAVSGGNEPLLVRLADDPSIGKGSGFTQGKTINMLAMRTKAKISASSKSADRESLPAASYQRMFSLYNVDQNSISNIEALRSIAYNYAVALNNLTNLGANRIMLTEASNAIRISGNVYRTLYAKIQDTYITTSKSTGQVTINLKPIIDLLTARIDKILKTGTFEKDNIKDKEGYKEDDNQVVAAKLVKFFKDYLKDYMDPAKMTRPQDRKFYQGLSGEELKKALVQRKRNFFKNHFKTKTNFNNMLKAVSEGKFDLVKFILRGIKYNTSGSSNITDQKISDLYKSLFGKEISAEDLISIFKIATTYAKAMKNLNADKSESSAEYTEAYNKIKKILENSDTNVLGNPMESQTEEEAEAVAVEIEIPVPASAEEPSEEAADSEEEDKETSLASSEDSKEEDEKEEPASEEPAAEPEAEKSEPEPESGETGDEKKEDEESKDKVKLVEIIQDLNVKESGINGKNYGEEAYALLLATYSTATMLAAKCDYSVVISTLLSDNKYKNIDKHASRGVRGAFSPDKVKNIMHPDYVIDRGSKNTKEEVRLVSLLNDAIKNIATMSSRITSADLVLEFTSFNDNTLKINKADFKNAVNKVFSKYENANKVRLSLIFKDILSLSKGEEISNEYEEIELKIKTVLDKPRDGDYDDFMRKYGTVVAFLSLVDTSGSYKEILLPKEDTTYTFSELKQKILAKDSIASNSLKDNVDEDSYSILQKSLDNLRSFASRNVDGIIFEDAKRSKQRIKLKSKDFGTSILLIQRSMKDVPENVFSVVNSFIVAYELVDLNGKKVATNIEEGIDDFLKTDKAARNVKEENGDAVFSTESGDSFKYTGESFELLDINGAAHSILPARNVGNLFDNKLTREETDVIKSVTSSTQIALTNNVSKTLRDTGLPGDTLEKASKDVVDTLSSSSKENEEKDTGVESVQSLLDHPDIKILMKRVYLDKSLLFFLTQMSDTQLHVIKNKDQDAINMFKARLITTINPDFTAIKNEIRNLCGEGKQIRQVFDKVFLSKKFNEEAFKGAYGTLIVSAVDKIVRSKSGRITEGFFQKLTSLTKAVVGNVGIPFAVMQGLKLGLQYFGYGAAIGTAAPYLLAFGSLVAAKGIYDQRKWYNESQKYKDNPIKYIEGLLDDKNAKKVAKGLVNTAVSDIVVRAIDSTHRSPAMGKAVSLRGGQSEFSEEIKSLTNEYNNLSEEHKARAKDLNDWVLGQMAQTQYFKKGIISNSILNMIFNNVMFGENRVSDECRTQILTGRFDIESSEYRKELIDSLVSAVKSSPVKNNFIDYIESHARKNNRKGALRMASENEVSERNNTNLFGMRKSAFVSNEQIERDYTNELISDMLGMSASEFMESRHKKDEEKRFDETFIRGSLMSLLFEDSAQTMSKEERAKKQKTHDREVDAAVVTSTLGIPWAVSALNMIKMKQVVIGGTEIWDSSWTQPTTSGGTPGLFGYKLSATLPKMINTVYRSAKEAAQLNKQGSDALGPQFELPDGNVFQSYYYNGQLTIGKAGATSGILVKPGIKAQMMGHLSGQNGLAKHLAYLKQQGILVDTKTGAVTIIKGGGAVEIPVTDPAYMQNLNTISTSLEGSAKVSIPVTSEWNGYNQLFRDLGTDAANADFKQALAEKIVSEMIERGANGEQPDCSEFSQWLKLIAERGADTRVDMTKGSISDMTPEDFASVQKGIVDSISDLKGGLENVESSMHKVIAKKGCLDVIKDFFTEGDASEQKMAIHQVKVLLDGVFNKTIAGTKTTMTDVVVKLSNKGAHAGLDLKFGQALQGGSLSLKKAAASGSTGLQKQIKTLAGHTTKSMMDVPDGFDWSAAAMKTGAFSILPIKILTTFGQRGVQGGKFAEFFYKFLNPQKVFYVDFLMSLIGAPVMLPKKVETDVDKNGSFDGKFDLIEFEERKLLTYEPSSPAAMPITDLAVISKSSKDMTLQPASSNKRSSNKNNKRLGVDQEQKVNKNQLGYEESRSDDGEEPKQLASESFVYNVSLSNYLFENNVVTKTSKASKINKNNDVIKEISEHRKLQKLFKDMF